MSDIMYLENGVENAIRTIKVNDDPWFVLKDVCEFFGTGNHRQVASRLSNDEKGFAKIQTPGGKQNMITVNGNGLCSVLFSIRPRDSLRNSNVVDLRNERLRWVRRLITHKILPSIRRTGACVVSSEDQRVLKMIFKPEETDE